MITINNKFPFYDTGNASLSSLKQWNQNDRKRKLSYKSEAPYLRHFFSSSSSLSEAESTISLPWILFPNLSIIAAHIQLNIINNRNLHHQNKIHQHNSKSLFKKNHNENNLKNQQAVRHLPTK